MSQEVRDLEPKALWNNFADLNTVPRPSKKEERVIAFMKEFGEGLGLETIVDKAGNVIIKKPASQGMENRLPVVLQSHLDMVHQKNADTEFDFDTEGIRMFVQGDWVKADGTTLGADNGIGVATIMAVLQSNDIAHPPIEALFTIDEETGMTGAFELEEGLLDGKVLLNLDTEDDRELTIGCAGGIDVTARGVYTEEDADADVLTYKITVNGLNGGHSGMDIHKGLGNANKLMNRLLYCCTQDFDLRIAEIQGGGLRNAIPRESFAVVTVPRADKDGFENYISNVSKTFMSEYKTTDPDISIKAVVIPSTPDKVMNRSDQKELIAGIYGTPNGIYRMSPEISDLVQTSNNVARVQVENGEYSVMCLTRSSVDSEKMDLAYGIESVWKMIGAEVSLEGSYPGWAPNPHSKVVEMMADLYRSMFEGEPLVMACHAGLECGIIGEHYPELDMVSFGPNILGAHSPDERAQITSVQKYWKFFLETLKRIPEA